MCEAWPGPRCSPEMKTKLVTREAKMLSALEKFGEDSFEYQKAFAFYEVTQRDYDSTPRGIEALEILVAENPEDKENTVRLTRAKRIRKAQINAVNEVKNGRQEELKNIYSRMQTFFSEEEMLSIVESSREQQEAKLLRYPNSGAGEATEVEYQKYLDDVEKNMTAYYKANHEEVPAEQLESLNKLRAMEAPDKLNFTAYKEIPNKILLSKQHLDNELIKASAIQGVSPRIAASFYDSYREQYQIAYGNLPETERPDPPEKWVRGEFNASGYAKDFNSQFAPHDPASLYAIYRLRSDPDAIPDYLKKARNLISVDIETAGPHGGAGFKPENGRIIEVGMISYSRNGKEIERYSQLVRPDKKFIDEHGTGAEDVHNISVEDLKDSPSWEQIRPKTLGMLENKTLLAQNASFERTWLKYHADNDIIAALPVLDTLDLSRKHLDLPNYKLATICHEMKVPYGEGHRALHDADVTAQTYFNMQRLIKKAWRAKAARKSAPAIETVNPSRWDRK